MARSWRWWLAGLLTFLAFLVVTWVVTKYIPASWLSQAGERLAVGIGAGTVVAGLIAVWGGTFAMAKKPMQSGSSPAAREGGGTRGVTVKDNIGIVSAGDRVRNIQGNDLQADAPLSSATRGSRRKASRQARAAEVRVSRNEGIASAGDDTTNIQEDR